MTTTKKSLEVQNYSPFYTKTNFHFNRGKLCKSVRTVQYSVYVFMHVCVLIHTYSHTDTEETLFLLLLPSSLLMAAVNTPFPSFLNVPRASRSKNEVENCHCWLCRITLLVLPHLLTIIIKYLKWANVFNGLLVPLSLVRPWQHKEGSFLPPPLPPDMSG